jgi:hypothetical protein
VERRALGAAYAVLAVAALCLVWLPRHLPFVDLGQHLSSVAIWHHHDDPAWDFARYYDLELGPNPYWAVYALMHLLTYPFGVEAAARIVISLYVIGLPLSMLLLGRRFGASPWMGLFGFPLAFNFNLQWGFLNYCLGLPAALLALWAFDVFCERPSLKWGAAAALGGLSVYFFHLLSWGLFLGCAGLMGLLHQVQSRRDLLPRLGVWAVPALGGAAVSLYGSTYHMGNVGHLAFRFYPLRHHAREIAYYVWHGCAAGTDDTFGLVLLLLWAALLVTALRIRRAEPEARRGAAASLWRAACPRILMRLHHLRATACVVTALGAYFLLPRSVLQPTYWWGINVRFAAVIGVFLPLTVRGPLAGWRRWLMAPVVLAGLALLGDHFTHFRRADAFANGFDRLSSLPPPKSRVLVIVFMPWHDPTWRYDYMRNYYGVEQALHGGYAPWDFDNDFPMRYRQRFPAPDWSRPTFRWDQQARYWDYVLAFQAPRGLMAGHSPLSAQSHGGWTLWQLPGPRVDEPPGPAYPWEWAYDANWKP